MEDSTAVVAGGDSEIKKSIAIEVYPLQILDSQVVSRGPGESEVTAGSPDA